MGREKCNPSESRSPSDANEVIQWACALGGEKVFFFWTGAATELSMLE